MAAYIHWFGNLLLVLLSGSVALAQPTPNPKAAITNVRVEADSERVKIQYDVVGITMADSVYIQVESRSGGVLPATTVTGDIGRAVSPGTDRTIYWDYRLDNVRIDSEIRVTVTINRPLPIGGGPTNALLSALVPGLGTIFVQPNRKVGARPLITAAYAGLLVYGLVQRSRSQKQYAVYQDQRIDSDYDKANNLHHQYLVAVRAAAAIWLTDVIYTFLKGRKNDKQRAKTTQRLVLNYRNPVPTIGIQLCF